MIDLFYHPNDKEYPFHAVEDFEQEVADYVGMGHAVAVNSGTSALHLALLSAGVGPGDRVLCPSVCFVAAVNAIRYCGAEPVFYDMVPSFIGDSKALIVVHLLGHLVERPGWIWECNVPIIEDACQALGSKYVKGERKSDYVCFSFNWNKIITTGSGGMVLTKDQEPAEYMRYLAHQRTCHETGYNYRMNSIQAKMGLKEMQVLDSRINLKRDIASRYQDAFGDKFWADNVWEKSNYWLCAIHVSNRDKVIQRLQSEGIGCRPLWAPYAPFPRSAKLVDETVCLPSHPWLTVEDQERVIKAVNKVL